MKQKYKALATIIFSSLLVYSPFLIDAQEFSKDGVITEVSFRTSGEQPDVEESQSILRSQLHMSPNDELRLSLQNPDKLGMRHDRYQQYYQGVKVEFGTYIVHSKSGKIQSMNGDFFPIKGVNTSPGLSEEKALEAALEYIGASSYMWEFPGNELFAKANEPSGTFYPKGELVVVKQFYTEGQQPDLAYKFNIYAAKPVSRDYVYVNAHTGKVVFKNAILKHCFHSDAEHLEHHPPHDSSAEPRSNVEALKFFATGTAATRYSGSRSIETGPFNGNHRLRETTRGNGINTFDCNTGTSYNAAVDFIDNDNNWTAAEWDNAQKDNAALDAHWGAEVTYDYFLSAHNRNSFDGNGASINSYVHFDQNYDNAFWDGVRMTYGDGNTFDALTSLDVAAHEIGHGVCTFTADLIYQNESGALNEAFSDIWAACVEDFAAPEKEEWLVGEDIGQSYGPLRNMENPNARNDPDTYQGTYWATGPADNGGVHTNSGVLNHCFYILTIGKSGTNDNNDTYSVTGIGFDKAAAIFYRAESVYLTQNSNYAAARTACINSALDLYGANSDEVCATTNAFYAVGVGASSSCQPPSCTDGIQNGDETGVDCGGSCPNTCPTCTDGVQNGDEEGIDCGGSNCAPCPCEDNTIVITLNFDNYPEETSWTLVTGGATVASGGTYGNQPDGSTLTIDVCVVDGCYDFTIFDSYGDGICCGYGNGSYSVTDAGGSVLASGGNFGSSETTNFCVTGGGGPILGCTDPNAHNYDPSATQDDGSCETCTDGEQNGDETGIDCGGSLCAPCGGGGCTTVTVNANDFESGWGIWNDGGSDCRRSINDAAYANSGSYCARIRDNTSTSNFTSDPINLNNYEEVTIEYSMYARSMEFNEDYFVEMNTGSGWVVLANYARGVHFNNNTRYSDAIVIPGPFSSATQFRFRCDASGNSDWVYIDDVIITGCVNGGAIGLAKSNEIPSGKILEQVVSFDVAIYPNPVLDELNIEYVSNDSRVEIRIFNSVGQEVLVRDLDGLGSAAQLPIDQLLPGHYYLRAQSGSQVETLKFVKL